MCIYCLPSVESPEAPQRWMAVNCFFVFFLLSLIVMCIHHWDCNCMRESLWTMRLIVSHFWTAGYYKLIMQGRTFFFFFYRSFALGNGLKQATEKMSCSITLKLSVVFWRQTSITPFYKIENVRIYLKKISPVTLCVTLVQLHFLYIFFFKYCFWLMPL